jgi:uncharacterized protein
MRVIPSWATTALVVVVVLGVVVWLVRWLEPRLAFFPFAGETVTPRSSGVEYQPLALTTADGERLHAWHLARPDAHADVVYFHGNGGNLSVWSDVLVELWRQGFDVLAIDYRGYGLSTGTPSEQGLYRDVDATLRFVDERPHARSRPLIYWGRSLGTVMAAYAASRRAPDGIVLESGFPSMRSVLETNPVMWVLSWGSSYRMPTVDWMAGVRQPTLVLHGDRDSVIPYRLGQRLYAALPGPKTFVTLPGGEHNEPVPPDAEAYWRAVRQFTASLSAARPTSSSEQR